MRKVSATISRRDPLRKYMDVIEAMLARSGALLAGPQRCCPIPLTRCSRTHAHRLAVGMGHACKAAGFPSADGPHTAPIMLGAWWQVELNPSPACQERSG